MNRVEKTVMAFDRRGICTVCRVEDCKCWLHPTNGRATTTRSRELVPVSLDADTAGLVERLERRAHAARMDMTAVAIGDAEHFEQAATALRTITAERDALRDTLREIERDSAGSLCLNCQQNADNARATLKGTDA